jgi:hypothetical protein
MDHRSRSRLRNAAKLDADARQRANAPLTRLYYCHTCGRQVESERVPSGWYSLFRTGMPGVETDYKKLGFFCSGTCLLNRAIDIAEHPEKYEL